jgi:hypothetical protein
VSQHQRLNGSPAGHIPRGQGSYRGVPVGR